MAIYDILQKVANNKVLMFDEERELEHWFQSVEETQSLFAELWHDNQTSHLNTDNNINSPDKVVITNDNGVVTTDPDLGFTSGSFAVGGTLSSGSITVTSSTGAQVSGLTIGAWYAIEANGGPWHAGSAPYNGNYYDFNLSNDGITFSGRVGLDDIDGFLLVIPDFAAYVEPVDDYYGRAYFQAGATSVWIRCADVSFGDNTGTLSYTLKSATVTLDQITLDSIEYTIAKLPAAIHTATAKTTPVDGDEFPLWDSAVNLLKKVTWANIKATLKTYFDTIYAALSHTHVLVDEDVQDIVGAMVAGNTETGIDVTYNDTTGKLDFSVTATGGSELVMEDGVTFPPVPLTTEDGTDWLYAG